MIAQQVSGLGEKIERLGETLGALERRVEHAEKVNTGLEEAALTPARALQEISAHWDKVYEAMRRRDSSLG